MSYHEKKTIVAMGTGAAVLITYCLYAHGRFQAGLLGPDDGKAWAIGMLLFTGIGVVAAILGQIGLAISIAVSIPVKRQMHDECYPDKAVEREVASEMAEDEMSKLIELKSLKVGFAVAGGGFVAALAALALGFPVAVMLNVLFLSLGAGSLLEGGVQLLLYKRGVKNG
ncbi:MAG: hypothetical protein A2087_09830 [Spirochaetes bacterium GWD1_61_31]|nr:MAG: hypothetical protein A2Y37_07455 [Spirochaetes bacterium GWB1_60_80]OHD34675.1 MAG: hypothetical protein A2004_01375 [Spirochaetes bacterium GWC1_61_12]OHD34961.1 MAG: hypothetical protein A2087_09830 [Spirochaetes bacterium GWD1_61_31]OHD42427.1 MAG: hypothetical protein A2Y35_06240 [Spirochaetes bacterium GWE1_60_18]OHD59230.1 MAG: hypothetical protein A2Y32_00420 [Spirochaetes bacterium GWF1_60_12]HAP43068.1 hypothetical protein [Spirochaetaceae bacterium]